MSVEIPQNPQLVPEGNLTVNPVSQKRSNFPLVLLSLLVLVLVGFGGFILAKYLNTPKTEAPVSSQPPVATPAPTQSPFSTVNNIPPAPTTTDETANWKNYENAKYGFSFKYPEDLKISVITKPSDPQLLESVDLTTTGTANVRGLLLGISTGPESALVKSYVDSSLKQSPFSIGGSEAKLYSGYSGIGGSVNTYVVVVVHGGYTYLLSFGGFAQADFNQILSTFKFL